MNRWAIFFWCAAWPTAILAQEPRANTDKGEFPYIAYVRSDNTPLRSGPGKVHYVANILEAGRQLEVWRHDPGGWLAVRPPADSASWVAAEHVEATGESGIGRIRIEGATAWVAAADETVKDKDLLWQVRLNRGELVELRDTRPAVTPSQQPWYKIAPPAGEFRWVHERFFSTRRIDPEKSKTQSAVARASATEVSEPANSGRSADVQPTPSDAATSQPSISFSRRVRDTEITLSLILSQPVENWRFDEVRTTVTKLVGNAETDLQRGQARVLLDKLNQFATLQTNVTKPITPTTVAETAAGATAGETANQTDNPRLAPRRPRGLRSDIDPRYDRFGWLVEVRSRQPNAPHFALVDDRGQVVSYLSAGPGLNLHRYLRKEIGVYGTQGYLRTLKAPHLTAHRVVELDRHRR